MFYAIYANYGVNDCEGSCGGRVTEPGKFSINWWSTVRSDQQSEFARVCLKKTAIKLVDKNLNWCCANET